MWGDDATTVPWRPNPASYKLPIHLGVRISQPAASNPDLSALISTTSPGSPVDSARENAWARFVTTYTPLLLRIARAVTHDHDSAMDAYAFVLGQLREDDCRRLLSYKTTVGCSYQTWLAVVARRLCLDHIRIRYGRARTDDPRAKEAQRERRRLADLVAVAVEPELATTNPDPSATLEQAEILDALEATLGELAPRDKLLLRYRFDDDLSAREIARLMRFPSVFHVYRRVNALLASCKSALHMKGFRGSDA